MTEKRDVFRYFLIGGIVVVLISIVLVLRGGPTGYAVYTEIGGGQTVLTLQEADVDNLGDVFVLQGQPNNNYGGNPHCGWNPIDLLGYRSQEQGNKSRTSEISKFEERTS